MGAFVHRPFLNFSFAMIKNYITVAIRNLIKNKLFSFINLLGLSIGTAVVILIMLYVKEEWTYDQFHTKSDHIYRAWVKEHFKGELIFNSVTPLILGDELKNSFPEIRETARFMNANALLKKGAFIEDEKVNYVDPALLKIFDFPLLKGKKENVFTTLREAVLTEEIAEKYFGDSAPIGQNLSMQVNGEWVDFLVSGIIEKAPGNSSLQFQILVPFENAFDFIGENGRNCWTCVYGETYVLLDTNANLENLKTKIAPFIDEKVKSSYQPGEYIVGLQPLTDIHLNNAIPTGIAVVSDARYPYILASVAFLILLLACINFTILSVGRSVNRSKEVGIRKVTGATKWQLRFQFWSEAIMMALFGLSLGLVLTKLLLPYFNTIADKQLSLDFNIWNFSFLIGLALITGLLSGIYPAMVLSGFNPIQAIKGVFSKIGNNKHRVLRTLVGFQFVLSIFLIICTFGMQKQLRFLQNKNLGFSKEQTLIVPYGGTGKGFSDTWQEALQIQERLKKELAGKGVQNILTSSHTFGTQGWAKLGYTDERLDKFRQFIAQQIDYEYLDIMEIEMKAGRKFSKGNTTDNKAAIVNEAFAKAWEINDLEGATMPEPFNDYKIIGISKDFNFASLHSSVEPLVMVTDVLPLMRTAPDHNFTDSPLPKFSFKIKSDNLVATIGNIQRAWKGVVPEETFNYTFMDDSIDQQYRSESRLSEILSIATGLAIIIACLGLFGIATLTISQRRKEIGVRKVLGASSADIVYMLNKRFTILIFIASLIATPFAWYFMNQWLSDFAYQTELGISVFLIAGLLTLLIAWLSVSFQSIKAALMNPVESLRNE